MVTEKKTTKKSVNRKKIKKILGVVSGEKSSIRGVLDDPSEDGFITAGLDVDEKARFRNWFVTVNQKATCFSQVENICNIELSGVKVCWAYILHDKDIGVLPHYHVVLSFEDAKSFSKIKKLFAGGHVQVCRNLGQSYVYLTHDTIKSIREGKHPYSMDDVFTNNKLFFNVQIKQIEFEPYDPSQIMRYVFVDGVENVGFALLRFGSSIQRTLTIWHDAFKLRDNLHCFDKYVFTVDENNDFDIKAKGLQLANISSVQLTDFGRIWYQTVIKYQCFENFDFFDFSVAEKFFPDIYKKLDLDVVKGKFFDVPEAQFELKVGEV